MNKSYFLSQPHQPFFLLGLINAIVAMLIFALGYTGHIGLNIDEVTFHVYSLVFLVFTNLFIGFLFTTFPRFNQTDVVQKNYYTNLFYLNIISSILFFAASWLSHFWIVIAMLLVFVSQLLFVRKLQNIYNSSAVVDKTDSFWILTANYFGLFANILFILSVIYFSSLQQSAISIAFYLYLILTAVSVTQRMVPFFSNSLIQKNHPFMKIILVSFIVLVVTNVANFTIGSIAVDLFLAFYIFGEILRWKLHPFNSPAIIWILHLAVFWLPVAFLFSAISLIAAMMMHTTFYFLGIHLLALGFLTTLLIGFATRVTLGHSNQIPHADKITVYIFYFTQIVVLFRALYSVNISFGWGLGFLFDLAVIAWILMILVWSIKYIRFIIFKNI